MGSDQQATCASRRRSIKYRESVWRVQECEVWSGELVCRCAVVHMAGSLLVWVGGAAPRLQAVALGAPGGPSVPLLGAAAAAAELAAPLAARLAAALHVPVYVCSGDTFDRFTMPLVEKALIAQIKSKSNT